MSEFKEWWVKTIDYLAPYFMNLFLLALGWTMHKEYINQKGLEMDAIYLISLIIGTLFFIVQKYVINYEKSIGWEHFKKFKKIMGW